MHTYARQVIFIFFTCTLTPYRKKTMKICLKKSKKKKPLKKAAFLFSTNTCVWTFFLLLVICIFVTLSCQFMPVRCFFFFLSSVFPGLSLLFFKFFFLRVTFIFHFSFYCQKSSCADQFHSFFLS